MENFDIPKKDEKERLIPHKIIHGGNTFIQLSNSDDALIIRFFVDRIKLRLNKDGSPVINPRNGRRAYKFDGGFNLETLTSEEFQRYKEAGFN